SSMTNPFGISPEAWTMWRMTLVPLEKTMPFGRPTPSKVRQSQFLLEIPGQFLAEINTLPSLDQWAG
ncbi:hypothetical protein, partial [Rhodoblastus acidophilus]|uniref:hypothetical protein n=1 Tax=Rhodoblastus acidophilus TaxID=1074 RepID=UPI002224B0A2